MLTPPETYPEMYQKLLKEAETIDNVPLKNVVIEALTENKRELFLVPGGGRHHRSVGGLLWHTYDVLRLVKGALQVYPDLNHDLLISAAILHDIGKCFSSVLEEDGTFRKWTNEEMFKGHLYLGSTYVSKLCEKHNVDPQTSLLLEHMILSHHGKPEWGAIRRPMTREAFVLHQCDAFDTGLFIFQEAYSETAEGEFSEREVWGSRVFKEGLRGNSA